MPTGYASIAEADTYLSGLTAWTGATSVEKQRSLDAGRIALDSVMIWNDDVDGTEQDIKDANCELALIDIQGLLYPDLTSPVVEEEQLGPMRRKFRSAGDSGRGHLFTRFPKVKGLVKSYGTITGQTGTLLRA